MTLSITAQVNYAGYHYAECRILFIVLLSIILMNAIMLNAIMLNVNMLSVIMLNVVIAERLKLIVVAPNRGSMS